MFVDWQLFRRRALGTSLAALAVVFIIWNIPALGFALYPFRLFVTFIHEAGHGLAAILTGGEFIRFEVAANGSGLATTRGGSRAVIISSGYLGAATFGATLFYITNRLPYPRILAAALGAGLIVLSGLYGQTSEIALTVGVAFGAALCVMGLFATRYFIVFMLNLLAILTALNAVFDLLYLTQDLTATTADGRVLNDAAAFSVEITPDISPVLWAWGWALYSLLILGMAVYRSLLRPILTDRVGGRRRAAPPMEPDAVYYEENIYEEFEE